MTATLLQGLRQQIRGEARREWQVSYRSIGKRLADIICCLLLLPFAIPVSLVMYILVRQDGGPGLYAHTRIGRSGRAFRCWKLRSMVPDAPQRLAQVLASDTAMRAEWQQHHKLTNDPRVTRIGQVLRQTSLDELPQLWNVLRGDMSLIGPRPVTKAELQKYGRGRRAYLSLRPGLTGLWQVSGRNDLTYDARVALDMAYHRQVSLGLDLQILLKTVKVVIRRTGI